jgi:hypothetical protein
MKVPFNYSVGGGRVLTTDRELLRPALLRADGTGG